MGLSDWQVDEGVITEKDLLPITEFAYGPLKYDMEKAKITIGSLRCSIDYGVTYHIHLGLNQARIMHHTKKAPTPWKLIYSLFIAAYILAQ